MNLMSGGKKLPREASTVVVINFEMGEIKIVQCFLPRVFLSKAHTYMSRVYIQSLRVYIVFKGKR